jgi:fructosamine-3-kinase
MIDWQQVASAIGEATGEPFTPDTPRTIGGGCINHAVRLSDGRRDFFVKINDASLAAMFEAEFQGLKALADAKAIRVPRPIVQGVAGDSAWLALEHIDMGGGGNAAQAGAQLAALHQVTESRFGWIMDNTIGSTHQPNAWLDDWVEFWRQRRLGFQLELAARNGHGGRLQQKGERLMELFPALIDHHPRPSLLHGDLWGGNLAYARNGDPVIFDPAVYYGDGEADLAMTELFGGFGRAFYDAYQQQRPIDPGYATRKTLYNLYHILNHLNIFGGGYGGQALSMTERLLAELGH